jgi:guanylate kinase
MSKGVLILAASGTGKTTAAQQFPNTVDLDSINYAFLYDKELYGELDVVGLQNLINGWLANPNKYKQGSIRWNPAGPDSYINAIAAEINKGNTVLVPYIQRVFELCIQHFSDVEKIIIFPQKDSFSEIEVRYRERGNDENFIAVRRGEFDALAKLFDEAEGFKKITLETGQFVNDVLENIKLNVQKSEPFAFL